MAIVVPGALHVSTYGVLALDFHVLLCFRAEHLTMIYPVRYKRITTYLVMIFIAGTATVASVVWEIATLVRV